MNILIQFTTLNYKMWHSFAKHLLELYPGSRVGAIASYEYGADHVLKFLTEQKDVKYEFIETWHDVRDKAFYDADIDYAALKKFEESTPYKSLWRMIAADRTLGAAFMHGSMWMNSFTTDNATRENILKSFSGLLKHIEGLFDRFKPDLYLPAAAMGSVEVYIFEHLCKERGVVCAVPATCRIEDIFAFASDRYSLFVHIEDMFKKSIGGERSLDLTKGEELYKKLTADFTNNQFFDRQNKVFQITKLETWPQKLKYIAGTAGAKARVFRQWIKEAGFRHSRDIRRQTDNFRSLWSNLLFVLARRYNNYVNLLNPKFGTRLPKEQKYIYFPLHMTPELSTQIQGTMWLDQVHLIESLAKSIPADWVVYVKEHPATLTYRSRPFNYYKQIIRFPNVVMAPIDMDMNEIISNAQMVAVITGTSGWEAILRGVPVIHFGECYWQTIGLSRRCSNLDRLPVDIHEEYIRSKNISPEERKRRLVHFLAAVLEGGFRITYVQQYGYNAPATDEQFDHIGKELAQYLVKYLDYLRNMQGNKNAPEKEAYVR